MFKIYGRKVFGRFSIRGFCVALATSMVVLLISVFLLGFVLTKQITIKDGETEMVIITNRFYVEEVFAENNITLRTGDRLSVQPDSKIKNNDVIVITRAKKIAVTVDGGTRTIYSCQATLKEALDEAVIFLEQYDEIEPVLETQVSDDMNVTIYRVQVENITVEEVVPREVIKRPNHDLAVGQSKVLKEGNDGLATREYKIITRDGEEISKEMTYEEMITEPSAQITEYGVKNTKVVASSRGEIRYKKVLQVNASAYEPGPHSNGKYAGKTATGRTPVYGIVAVDPKVIPLNSRLYIESCDGGQSWVYGYAIAGDTGGAIKGNRIDLCFNTVKEAYAFGRRSATVYVLE